MQVREFLTMLARRWKLIVACVLLVTAAAAVATMQQTPVYESKTRVFLASDAQGYLISSADLGTFVELLGSPVIQDPVRAKLGLDAGTPLNIAGSVSDNAPILDILVRSANPQVAYAVANEVGPQLESIGGQYAPLLAAAGGSVKVTALVPPTMPGEPISPNLRNNIALGAAIGLALGVGVALLVHFLDTRIRTANDVEALTDRPILATLPRARAGETGMIMEDSPHSIAAEEYRRLRTNLQFVDVTTGGKHSFVVTSAMPSEGKTTTAVNLARAYADSGARVLLVDADLRNPSVARMLGLEGSVGLTTVLLGQARLADILQPWPDSDLDVLPAGPVPPNPSELLGSEATASLFDQMLDAYDMVIVDSPPVNPVIDAVLLGRLTGGLLLVVSAQRGRKREVSAALKSLDTVDQEVAGVALNMVPQGESSYGTYYGYGDNAKRTSRRRRRPAKAKPATVREPGPARRSKG